MTNEEINNMLASREMDEMVGVTLGLPEHPTLLWDTGEIAKFKPYSTDLASAWELFKPGWYLSEAADHTWAILVQESFSLTLKPYSDWRVVATGETAPLVICRAALLTASETTK